MLHQGAGQRAAIYIEQLRQMANGDNLGRGKGTALSVGTCDKQFEQPPPGSCARHGHDQPREVQPSGRPESCRKVLDGGDQAGAIPAEEHAFHGEWGTGLRWWTSAQESF